MIPPPRRPLATGKVSGAATATGEQRRGNGKVVPVNWNRPISRVFIRKVLKNFMQIPSRRRRATTAPLRYRGSSSIPGPLSLSRVHSQSPLFREGNRVPEGRRGGGGVAGGTRWNFFGILSSGIN